MSDVQKDDTLNKLVSLLYFRNCKLEKKVKGHSSKVRRLIISKSLVSGKNPCDKGKD